MCTDVDGLPTCGCPSCTTAEMESGPVCTDRGNTFSSICSLKRHNCREGLNEQVVTDSPCDQGK